MKIKIIEHGVMLPDYFSGTSGVMLSIHITPRTTIKETLDMIESEISAIYDHIDFTFNRDFNVNSDVIDQAIDNCIADLRSHNIKDDSIIYRSDFEYSEDEYEENPVAIFTLELDEE